MTLLQLNKSVCDDQLFLARDIIFKVGFAIFKFTDDKRVHKSVYNLNNYSKNKNTIYEKIQFTIANITYK